ncbi:hypothetical protein [Stenotrophomonas phage RAS14]
MQPSYIGDINEVIYGDTTGTTASGVRVIAMTRTSTKNGNGIVVYYSTDGKVWNTNWFYLNSPNLTSIAFLENVGTNGTLVAISQSSTSAIFMWRSTDLGATWTTKTVTHGIAGTVGNTNQLVADNKRNRLMIGSSSTYSTTTAKNIVLQSFDAGDTWSVAYTATNANTRVILSSQKLGRHGIVGRIFSSAPGGSGDSGIIATNETDDTVTFYPLPSNTPIPYTNNRTWTGTYNPQTDTYAFRSTTNNSLHEFDGAFTTFTDRPLGFTFNSGETFGSIIYYPPSNDTVLITINSSGGVIGTNTSRIFKSKTGTGGWTLDDSTNYEQSGVQFANNCVMYDNQLGIISGYIQSSVFRGAGIGYIGTPTQMPTPTPSATATMSATPRNNTNAMMAYGRIGQANGIAQTGYTLFDNDGNNVLTINVELPVNDFIINSFHVEGTNELIVFGQYGSINGIVPTVSVNRIDRVGTLNPTWSVTGIGVSRNISSMVKISENEYYIGVNGGRVYKMNGNGVVDTAWGTTIGTHSTPYILIDNQNSNKMYIASSSRIIKVDIPSGTIDSSFATVTVNGTTSIRQQSDGSLLAFGQFNTIGGVSKSYFARVSTTGVVDPTFTIITTTGSGINVPLNNLEVLPDDSFIVAGFQVNIDGQTGYSYLNKFKSNGRLDPSFNQPIIGSLYGIKVLNDGRILVGATGTIRVNEVSRNGIVRLNYDGTLDTTFNGSVTTNAVFGVGEYSAPLVSLTPTQTPSVTPTHTPVPSAIYDTPLAFRIAQYQQ